MDTAPMCEKHNSQELVSYCETHMQPLCYLCYKVGHKSCTSVMSLSDAATKYTNNFTKKRTKGKLTEFKKKLTSCKVRKLHILETVQRRQHTLATEVAARKEIILRKVDNLTNVAIQNRGEDRDRLISDLRDDVEFCNKIMHDIQQQSDALEASSDKVTQLLTIRKTEALLESDYAVHLSQMQRETHEDKGDTKYCNESFKKLEDLDKYIDSQDSLASSDSTDLKKVPTEHAVREKKHQSFGKMFLIGIFVVLFISFVTHKMLEHGQANKPNFTRNWLRYKNLNDVMVTDLDFFPDGERLLMVDFENNMLLHTYANQLKIDMFPLRTGNDSPVSVSVFSESKFILATLNNVGVYEFIDGCGGDKFIEPQQGLLYGVTCVSSVVRNAYVYLLCYDSTPVPLEIYPRQNISIRVVSISGQKERRVPLQWGVVTRPVKLMIDHTHKTFLIEDYEKGLLVFTKTGEYMRPYFTIGNPLQTMLAAVEGYDKFYLFQRKASSYFPVSLLHFYLCQFRFIPEESCTLVCYSEVFDVPFSGVYSSVTKTLVMVNRDGMLIHRPFQ